MANTLQLTVPEVFRPLFTAPKRKNILYGGRGSGKSHQVARYIIQRAMQAKTLVLCTRELQNTIADSVHALLKHLMEEDLKVAGYTGAFFEIQKDKIIGENGSRFIFTGVRNNVNEIKSMEGVQICWVEEAQAMTQTSLDVLIPTIRAEGSILIFTFNPFKDSDPIYQMAMNPDEDTLVVKANYLDNPFFPEVLRHEMDNDRRNDYDKYLWVWEGQCLGISKAQIFRGKYEVKAFDTPENAILHFGADWGFSNDPTVVIRSFIIGNSLYIDQEAGEVGCDIADTPELFNKVEGTSIYPIYADPARPETISAMQNYHYNVIAADKWQGSVEDGISYLRSFDRIYIHPRCVHTIEEFDLYQYKVDKQTNEVLREPLDKFNHYIDALRYSHTPTMRAKNGGKVYNEFTMDNIATPFSLNGRETFVGTFTLPGLTLVCAMQVIAGRMYIVVSAELKGGVAFDRIVELLPKDCKLIWLPFAESTAVAPNLLDDAIKAGVEPSVPAVLLTDNEGTITVNKCFKNRALRIFSNATLAITAMNERVYRAGGKLEQQAKYDKNTYMAMLVEYTVWRVVGRMQ